MRRKHVIQNRDGVRFKNESGYTVPPYGVMEVTGYDHTNSYWTITRPTTQRNGQLWLVNRGSEVVDNGIGIGDFGVDKPVKVLSYGSFGADNPMAPKPGYWHLIDGDDTNIENVGFYPYSNSYVSPSDPNYDPGSGSTDPQYRMFYQFKENIDSSLTELGQLVLKDESASSVTLDTSTASTRYGYVTHTAAEYTNGNQDGGFYINRRVGIQTSFSTNGDPYTNGTVAFVRDGYYEFNLRLVGTFDITGSATDYDSTIATSTNSGHNHTVTVVGVANKLYQLQVRVYYRIASSALNFSSNQSSYRLAFVEHFDPPADEKQFTRFITFYRPAQAGQKLWIVIEFRDGLQNHCMFMVGDIGGSPTISSERIS